MIQQIDRTQAPSLKAISSFRIQQAEQSFLDNGIPMYCINAGFQDLVKVELLFWNPSFNPRTPLIHSAANRMLMEGTAKRSSQQIADAIDYFGAFFETEENTDYCSVNLFTLNKYLENTLPVVREILAEAVYPESELSVYRQNNKQRLIVENEKVGSVARRKFNEMIFGAQHPYGYVVQPEDYMAIRREDLQEFRKHQYASNRCTLIVSGKIKENTKAIINKILGDKNWNQPEAGTASPSAMQAAPEKIKYIPRENAVQSAIRIGKILFNRSHPDYPGMSMLNSILGGNFGSRLMSNIREDKGYTYGIGSAVVSMKQNGYFFISTEVGAEVTSPALEEIYKEVELLRNEEVEQEELDMVRNYMLGNFLKGMDGAFNLADRFKSIHMSGLDYDYYQRYLQKIKTIQSDEIRELAVKYLDKSTFYELVVGRK